MNTTDTEGRTNFDATRVGGRAQPRDDTLDNLDYVPGSKVGRYVVLEQVGRGGMGVVLAAFDPQLNRKIALKLLHPGRGQSESSGSAKHRLLREAQAIAMLSHPNVISVYDVGEIAGSIYVAMEFIEGCTLTGWLEQQKRSVKEIVAVFLQAGRGLAAAHAAGLVHRDFKPDNVLVGNDGTIRVSDFGLARTDPSQSMAGLDESGDKLPVVDAAGIKLDESNVLSATLTQKGVVVGTPRYMAPEQHAGQPADSRSDQFAFCVALYQALYGTDPFIAHSLERLARAKQEGRICPIPANARVPSYLGDVVLRGLSAEPNERFASMEELVTALERDPALWRNVIVGVVGVGVAAMVALGFGLSPSADSACEAGAKGDAKAWQSVWGDDRKQELKTALTTIDARHGERSWGLIETEVDRYLEQWSEARREACKPTERPVAALKLRCLERQQDQVRAILWTLGGVDGDRAPRVPRLVSVVPAASECASTDFVNAMPKRSTDEDAVAAVRAQLDRVTPLSVVGRHEEAIAIATQSVEDAEGIDFPPLRAEAKVTLGRAHQLAGHFVEAESALSEGVWVATWTKHDAFAATGASALVDVAGRGLQRRREARLWEEQARSVLRRLGLEGLPVAELDDAAGNLAFVMGDFPRARAFIDRAVSVRKSVRGSDDPRLAAWLVDLGNVMLAAGDHEGARKSYTDALALVEERLDDAHPEKGRARLGLGTLAVDEGFLIKARGHFTSALPILRDNLNARPLDLTEGLSHLARLYVHDGDLLGARELLEEALAVAEAAVGPDNPRCVIALSELANVDRMLGDVESARGRVVEGKRRMIRMPVDEAGPAASAIGLAEAELDLATQRYDAAIEGFQTLVDRLEAAKVVERRAVARARFGLARSKWARDRDPDSRNELERARAALAAEGPRGRVILAEIEGWVGSRDL